ncbi:MAG: hemin-degrading factor [Candidatus Hydrogenedentes bacterium]|nr:hemin-degrading factor [Candidatus Hydrogenedentota bacterium]
MTQTAHAMDNTTRLREQWEEYRAGNRRAFRYDAARTFGVSEAQLLAIDCGSGVTRLHGDWQELLNEFHALGRVMALTRNEFVVHEKKGHYAPVSFNGHVGLVLDEGIDLRLFMAHWAMGFSVHNPESKGLARSFQFFDASGHPVHKVFVDEEGATAFDRLTAKYQAPDQSPWQDVAPVASRAAERPDADIDVQELRSSWANIKDTHDFHPMLKRLEVRRTQACRLVGEAFAVRLLPEVYRDVFTRAAERELPIMIFAGNDGCIQIHTGPIARIFEAHGWFNIMDPGFNLHMEQRGIVEAWLIRKPTKDGVVTSIELFDETGRDIALLFGKRKPGIPELQEWRDLCAGLEASHRQQNN